MKRPDPHTRRETLILAVVEPAATAVFDLIGRECGLEVQPVLALGEQVDAALSLMYGPDASWWLRG